MQFGQDKDNPSYYQYPKMGTNDEELNRTNSYINRIHNLFAFFGENI